jgi:hypothetical protein
MSDAERRATTLDCALAEARERITELERQLADTRAHVERLAREVGKKDEACRRKDLYLDALGHVWCSGGCDGGTGCYSGIPMTEEGVAYLERNAARARKWFRSHECHEHRAEMERCADCGSRGECERMRGGA